MGTLIAIGIGGVVLAGLIALIRSGNKATEDMARARSAATARTATVLSWSESSKKSAGAWTRGDDRREVHVRVHVPGGEDFTASNVWSVAPGKGDLLVEGATITVRVHQRDAAIVFPDEPWLEYRVDDYAMKRYR